MPQLASSWLALEESLGGMRPVLRGQAKEMRAQVDGLVQMLLPLYPPPSENVEVQQGEADGIGYRIYTPKGNKGGLPLAIWTHGGGFMTGDLNSDHLLCCIISEQTNSAVVNIDYRLTPEFKTPLEDSWKVYRWANKNASTFGADPSKTYTIGGSAGGTLAFALANRAVSDPELSKGIKGIVAMVPVVVHPSNVPSQYQSEYKSWAENANDVPVLDKESMEIFYENLDASPSDKELFTLLATENHAKYPPTYLASCGADPLRDDSFIMEKVLKEAGVKTKHDHYEGQPHYFHIFPQVPESQQFVGNLIAGVEWIKGQM